MYNIQHHVYVDSAREGTRTTSENIAISVTMKLEEYILELHVYVLSVLEYTRQMQ